MARPAIGLTYQLNYPAILTHISGTYEGDEHLGCFAVFGKLCPE